MAKALIVYASRTGETEKIANLIAEGVRFSGHEADVRKVTDVKKEDDLKGFEAVVFGSPTYHGDMVQGMKTLLFLAEKAELEGKIGGAFGAFGWSGEAPKLVAGELTGMGLEMIEDPLRVQYVPDQGGCECCYEFGRRIAQAMKG